MITSQNTLLRIQLGIIGSYLLVNFFMRPFILDNGYDGLLKIFVLSYPNFCEAIVGSIFLTFAFLLANNKVENKRLKIKEGFIPFISVLLSGVYVILQEFKIHNLGGKNVYDPYDVGFSVLGLIAALCLILYLKPKIIIE